MKNPMDRKLEKRLSDRAVAIGREGEVAACGELLVLLRSSSANARRLAASALVRSVADRAKAPLRQARSVNARKAAAQANVGCA